MNSLEARRGGRSSDFGLGRGKIAGNDLVLKSGAGVGAIAEGLVLGLAATAESDHGTAGEAERLPGRVENLEIALDADRAVVVHSNSGS